MDCCQTSSGSFHSIWKYLVRVRAHALHSGFPFTTLDVKLKLRQFIFADDEILTDAQVKEIEKANILKAMNATEWRVYGNDGAASLLDIKPTTLASRLKKLGLEKP